MTALLRQVWGTMTWGDLALLALLSALTVGGLWSLGWSSPHGALAVIEVEGKPREHLSLRVDRVLPLHTERGTNLVEIRDGRVRMAEASCPNRVCVTQGWIRHRWEEIVCLPHRVTVRIRGLEEEYDAVTR